MTKNVNNFFFFYPNKVNFVCPPHLPDIAFVLPPPVATPPNKTRHFDRFYKSKKIFFREKSIQIL